MPNYFKTNTGNVLSAQQKVETKVEAIKNQVPSQVEVCPVCTAMFRSVDLLIEHSMKEHCAIKQNESKPQEAKASPKKRVDSEKCPQCFKRFSVIELPMHMQQDHFIF